jgi:hypothetical protein
MSISHLSQAPGMVGLPMFRYLAHLVIDLIDPISKPVERFFTEVLPNSGLDDPVYKKNVQKLIERNRRFEESKE